ncbi:MAG: hypothetical protein FJ398_15225 [Verrucomicrobia bacterium]|nr:hypothetical protein [Verrucomicrobiota bacterium]
MPQAEALGAEFLRRVRQLQGAQPFFIAILFLEGFARVTAEAVVVLVGKAEGPIVRVAALDLPLVFAMHPEAGMIAQFSRRGPHDFVAPDRVIGVVVLPEVVLADSKGLEGGADVTIVKEDGGEIAPDPIDDGFAALPEW